LVIDLQFLCVIILFSKWTWWWWCKVYCRRIKSEYNIENAWHWQWV